MRLELRGSKVSKKVNSLSAGRNKTFYWFLISLALVLVWCTMDSAKAEGSATGRDVKQELKKVEEIEKEDEAQSWLNQKIQPLFGEKVRLKGGIELNYEYLDVKDIDDKNSGSSSDFFMSTAELALRVFFNSWSKAKIVAAAEDVGKQGDGGKVRLNEAIATLKSLQIPLYLVGGKTVMPFGVFEDHLIEGTLAEDLYEIDDWGATLGFNPDFYGLDISFSVYRKPQVIENLQDFDTHDTRPARVGNHRNPPTRGQRLCTEGKRIVEQTLEAQRPHHSRMLERRRVGLIRPRQTACVG